jgi:hypothetical protein
VKPKRQPGGADGGPRVPVGYGTIRVARSPGWPRRAQLRRISPVALGSLLCAVWWLLPLRSAPEQTLEYEVKAAFLLNFAKFVDWPASAFGDAGSPLAICILGRDPFGRAIDDLVQGEEVGGRKLLVRRIAEPPPSKACQIVFTQQSGTDAIKPLSDLRGVLTVGEGESFVHDGGIIGFVIDNRRVRFDISRRAANEAGIKLSSKLLSVARAVEK